MKKRCNLPPAGFAALQLFLIYTWISKLADTDSFFTVYSFAAISAVFCMYLGKEKKTPRSAKVRWGIDLFAAVFSLSVIAGNYTLFQPVAALRNLLDVMLCFAGGLCICRQILNCLLDVFPKQPDLMERNHAAVVFWGTFVCVVVLDLTYLFSTNYPAIINYDAIAQLNQIFGLHEYNNWSPYWHTRTVGFFLNWGFHIFEDLNTALAFYEVWQVLFLAACLGYIMVTLYQIGIPKGFLLASFAIYVLLPYNIVFNVTIGKDVLFGAGLLLMLTALYRILSGIGKCQPLNYASFAAGILGFSLWRTNGWYICLVTLVILFPVCRRKFRPVLYTTAGVLVVCWVLLNPYLEAKGVAEAPATETMAIPFQQVARVIAMEREIPEEDEAFLAQLFNLKRVKKRFNPTNVDPIKFKAFHCDMDYYQENLGTFLKVWLRLGLKYPGEYLTAWIDLTRGYWTGGFHMGVYDQGIPKNGLGMFNSGGDSLLAKLFHMYFRCVEDAMVLQPLKSIGFVVWLVLIFWWVAVLQKRRVAVLALPVLILLVGLWIGAPVFAEFRYGYPVFLVSPLILFGTMFRTGTEPADSCQDTLQ